MQPLTLEKRLKLIEEIRRENALRMLREADRRLSLDIHAIVFSPVDTVLIYRAACHERDEREERREERRHQFKRVAAILLVLALGFAVRLWRKM